MKKKKKDETCYGLQYSNDDILPQSSLKKDIVNKLELPLPEMHARPQGKPFIFSLLDNGFYMNFHNIYLLL